VLERGFVFSGRCTKKSNSRRCARQICRIAIRLANAVSRLVTRSLGHAGDALKPPADKHLSDPERSCENRPAHHAGMSHIQPQRT
jgi:hypothetical protein